MSGAPLISVVLPVYSVEKYLPGCLDSLTGQTYRNLQIILVDDGSPDRCGRICEEYARNDPRIVVLHQENRGVSSARNAGMDAAAGEWIGFVDGDDYLERDMYETMLRAAEDAAADVVQCGSFWETPRERWVTFAPEARDRVLGGLRELRDGDWKLMSNGTCCKLYRRQLVNDVRYDAAVPVGEDLQFNLRAMRHAERIVLLQAAKYHYVQRGDSACRAAPTREKLVSYRGVLAQAMEEYGDIPALRKHLWHEQLRNDLDMCSRIVCCRLAGVSTVEAEIRREITDNLGYILSARAFTAKERVKFLTISKLWPVYRTGLPVLKRLTARAL